VGFVVVRYVNGGAAVGGDAGGGAAAAGISAVERRCDAGNANVGLVRLTEAPGVAWRAVAPVEAAWGEAVGIGAGSGFEAAPHPHSLFQRPPPRRA